MVSLPWSRAKFRLFPLPSLRRRIRGSAPTPEYKSFATASSSGAKHSVGHSRSVCVAIHSASAMPLSRGRVETC